MKLKEQSRSKKSTPKTIKRNRSARTGKAYSLDEVINRHIGKKGSQARNKFEHELNMASLGYMIRKTRLERNLTQEELGKRVGVQRAQISKLESGAHSATIDSILKVFTALDASIHFNINLGDQ